MSNVCFVGVMKERKNDIQIFIIQLSSHFSITMQTKRKMSKDTFQCIYYKERIKNWNTDTFMLNEYIWIAFKTPMHSVADSYIRLAFQ